MTPARPPARAWRIMLPAPGSRYASIVNEWAERRPGTGSGSVRTAVTDDGPVFHKTIGQVEVSDGHGAAQEVDDLAGRRSRAEHLGHPGRLQLIGVVLRNRPAYDDEDVVGAVGAQPVDDPRDERHVRAGENRDAHRVGVLLDRG